MCTYMYTAVRVLRVAFYNNNNNDSKEYGQLNIHVCTVKASALIKMIHRNLWKCNNSRYLVKTSQFGAPACLLNSVLTSYLGAPTNKRTLRSRFYWTCEKHPEEYMHCIISNTTLSEYDQRKPTTNTWRVWPSTAFWPKTKEIKEQPISELAFHCR